MGERHTKLVVPPLPTLLASSSDELVADEAPILCAVLHDLLAMGRGSTGEMGHATDKQNKREVERWSRAEARVVKRGKGADILHRLSSFWRSRWSSLHTPHTALGCFGVG